MKLGEWRCKLKKAIDDYRTDLWFRAEASVYMSCGVNITFSLYQILIGITRNSLWFYCLALYYVLITATRVLMLYYIRNEAEDGREELRRYRKCGIMMLVLTFMILVVGILMNSGNSTPKQYPGHMVFVVGVFTIYTFVNSILNLWRYRLLESPLISASKSVNLTTALVSLYTFEAAVFAQFRDIINPSVITLLNAVTAGGSLIAVIWMSAHIILRSTRALRGKEDLYIVIDDAKTDYQKEFRSDVSTWIANMGEHVPDWAREYSAYSDRYNSK
ncbi:MAG: hypothetical protein IKG21_00350 [Atopobiaceae bacterium]|nr:hypothetical protein [Atopobiaceae bacterium]